eukprot:CAMPEP_0173433322 /NCGR_PEP_ID=MMETSP1357-20121228/10807_1 /TAXON_ID=77926 /ORGANISM="Hemiselmis rufescens, Strain PCC563" /LENGTH=527 /DNA_ID=CAMNT_0014398015 /DNA_START=62 /DNA_END=1645 /DNA_ORIENTATION=-
MHRSWNASLPGDKGEEPQRAANRLLPDMDTLLAVSATSALLLLMDTPSPRTFTLRDTLMYMGLVPLFVCAFAVCSLVDRWRRAVAICPTKTPVLKDRGSGVSGGKGSKADQSRGVSPIAQRERGSNRSPGRGDRSLTDNSRNSNGDREDGRIGGSGSGRHRSRPKSRPQGGWSPGMRGWQETGETGSPGNNSASVHSGNNSAASGNEAGSDTEKETDSWKRGKVWTQEGRKGGAVSPGIPKSKPLVREPVKSSPLTDAFFHLELTKGLHGEDASGASPGRAPMRQESGSTLVEQLTPTSVASAVSSGAPNEEIEHRKQRWRSDVIKDYHGMSPSAHPESADGGGKPLPWGKGSIPKSGGAQPGSSVDGEGNGNVHGDGSKSGSSGRRGSADMREAIGKLDPSSCALPDNKGGEISSKVSSSISGSFKMMMGLMFTDAAHVVFDKHGSPPGRSPLPQNTGRNGDDVPPLLRQHSATQPVQPPEPPVYSRGRSDPQMVTKQAPPAKPDHAEGGVSKEAAEADIQRVISL